MMYTKLLIQSSKVKAALSIFLILFLAVFLGTSVSDFLADPEGLPLIFIIGISQVFFIAQYFFIRLIWRNQLLSVRDDEFYRFFVEKRDVVRLVEAKVSTLVHLLILHVVVACTAFYISSGVSANFTIFSGIEGLGILITLFVFSLDFMSINRIRKVYRTVVMTVAALSLIGLFYYPSYLSFGIVIGVILFFTIISLSYIRGGQYAKNC